MRAIVRAFALTLASAVCAQAGEEQPRAAEAPGASPAPVATAAELHRGADYPGAAGFMKLESATVVYPVRSSVDPAVAKASATARARWLEAAFHMRVEIVGDDAVTDAQKRGNLLILGWGNRLWETPGLARPFRHTADGLSFIGIEEADPDLDLLVFHRNPLEWSSYVLFWSRIDPERDRVQVIPRVGSDWAMYRGFYPMRQGMFKPARVWPPERDPVAEARPTKAGPARRGQGGTASSEHYRIAFDTGKVTQDEARAVLAARETAFQKATSALGPTPAGFTILLNLYVDEDDKRLHSGVSDASQALPWDQEIDMVRRFARSTSPHEEVHVVARSRYGPCYLTALYEGLAIAIEGTWHGKDLPAVAAMLRAGGALPTIGALLDEEKLRAFPDDVGLPASGAFVAWLRSAYGAESFAKIYGLREGRAAALSAALGTNETDLEGAFARWADAQVAAHKADLDFAAAESDAKSSLKAGDWKGMVDALRRALAAHPGDRQVSFNLASAQMRADDLEGAATTLSGLVAADLKPEESRFRVYGHYQLGRVYDLLGRREAALKEYDAVLALPDDHGSHALAEERKKAPATKDDLE